MLAARLGRRRTGLGRLASLRLPRWRDNVLGERLKDGAPLAAAAALAPGAALPPPPLVPAPPGVRLASVLAGSSLDASSGSNLGSRLTGGSSSGAGSSRHATCSPAVLPDCSSPLGRPHQVGASQSRGFASRTGGANGSSSSGADTVSSTDGYSSNSSSSGEQPVMVRHFSKAKGLPIRPELAGELAPLAALCGVTDRAALAAAVAALGPKRERGVVQHGAGVAAHLQQLGVKRAQLGALLQRCPYLFSWPAEQRAAVLFEQQLMGWLGLTAAKAACCFEQWPTAANVPSFAPAMEPLAELFAAAAREATGSAAGSSAEAAFSDAEQQAAERQLGQLLCDVPSAVRLLCSDAATLRQRCAALQQRYGHSAKQLVSALKRCTSLLTRDSDRHLADMEAALEEELGVGGRALVGAMLKSQARALDCSVDTLRQRCRALVKVFTLEQLHGLGLRPLSDLLAVDSTTWQLTLAVWQALGVADPAALALINARVLAYDWLAPGRLANLLALQRALGLSSPGAVVQQGLAGYVAGRSWQRVAGRLLLLEQAERLPLLVASKEQWRRDRGLPPGKPSPGEPPLISVSDVATLPDGARPGSRTVTFATAAGVSKEAVAAFMAGLPSHPPYQHLLAEAAALQERLLRDPEVARLAAEQAPAGTARAGSSPP